MKKIILLSFLLAYCSSQTMHLPKPSSALEIPKLHTHQQTHSPLQASAILGVQKTASPLLTGNLELINKMALQDIEDAKRMYAPHTQGSEKEFLINYLKKHKTDLKNLLRKKKSLCNPDLSENEKADLEMDITMLTTAYHSIVLAQGLVELMPSVPTNFSQASYKLANPTDESFCILIKKLSALMPTPDLLNQALSKK